MTIKETKEQKLKEKFANAHPNSAIASLDKFNEKSSLGTIVLMLGELQNIIEDLITRVEELEANK